MTHLSEWHENFDVENRDTYPQVMDSPVQLRFVSGFIVDFESFRIFLQSKAFHKVPVVAWRYIKGPD
jgi:hypothetical protein